MPRTRPPFSLHLFAESESQRKENGPQGESSKSMPAQEALVRPKKDVGK